MMISIRNPCNILNKNHLRYFIILIIVIFFTVLYLKDWFIDHAKRWRMNKDNNDNISLLYGPVALFFFSFLLEHIIYFFSFIKKLSILTSLKSWRYNFYGFGFFFISCLIMYLTYSEAPPNATFIALAGSIFYMILKQKHGYTQADINEAQQCRDGIGAFWAHHAYNSYYEVVLKDIRDRIVLFEKENNLELLTKKLVLIVPLSCDVRGTLTDLDEKVQHFKQLDPIECDQGANINRKYKNPVYKIGEEDIYILAESPSILLTLWLLKDSMQHDKWKYHRSCFIQTLKSLIHNSSCIIVEYDDTVNSPEPLYSCLLSSLTSKQNTTIQMEQGVF